MLSSTVSFDQVSLESSNYNFESHFGVIAHANMNCKGARGAKSYIDFLLSETEFELH